MPFQDLRDFLCHLERLGELAVVPEADWNLEIGTIAELNYERRGKALLFDRVKGYPPGYRILTNALHTRRRALLSLGFAPDLDMDGALAEYEKKIASYRPVPPLEVASGPVLENVFTGNAIDLWKFPVPKWHENDGGRYLGTGCAVMLRDPDTGKDHLGTYRVMVHDERTAGLYITPNHTGAIIRKKYWERGRSCPVAVSFGHDPMLFVGAAHFLGKKRGIPKYDLIGHFRGAPVEVIREEATGLPIPATAEIVIAGEVPPPQQEALPEGPFGEWTGYYGSGTRPEAIIRVRALYHRNDPIIHGEPPVRYRGPTAHFGIPTRAGNYKEKVQKAGVEDVLEVWPLTVPGMIVVQIRQRYPGHAIKAALAVIGEYMGRFVVVVDEDINPRDPEDVLWAIGTRCDPETCLTIIKGCQSSALDPRISPEQKKTGNLTNSQAIINACKPYEWMDRFPATNIASAELRKAVLEKWEKLFDSGQ